MKGVVEVFLSIDIVGDFDMSLFKFEEVDDNVIVEIDRFDYFFLNFFKFKDIKVDFFFEIELFNDNIELKLNEIDVILLFSFFLDIDSCNDFGV